MLRQRVHTRSNPLALAGRALVVLLGAALTWYGLMVLLLALKVAPSTINSISGYRSAYDYLAGLGPSDFTSTTRAIIAIAGVVAFLLFGYLALRELPRPYLARSDVQLDSGDRGETIVSPRAYERMAEGAALSQPGVTRASGRYGSDELAVDVSVGRAREVADALQGVYTAVHDALGEHDLPSVPVRVVLTGFDRKHKRELH